ncbi:hypothetical protein [Frankia sp. AgB32]|uniref:hypothetical protein n=1 Tax=Frankia sp. AgB32 TaxID=631119 RepID=UPI00200F4AF4|nr:hypothetical protein [Frankia sp. AgB32]MCK9895952.1 hypothetical protein [Frankia sp. AgB32]
MPPGSDIPRGTATATSPARYPVVAGGPHGYTSLMVDDLETELPLPGGRHVGGVRVGDTVRRGTGPWTPAAGPSSRELDLAFTALTWVPLLTPGAVAGAGLTDVDDRPRRLRLLLDAYGHDGDPAAFALVVAARARLNAEVIRRLGTDVLAPVAAGYEQSAREIDAAAPTFWA